MFLILHFLQIKKMNPFFPSVCVCVCIYRYLSLSLSIYIYMCVSTPTSWKIASALPFLWKGVAEVGISLVYITMAGLTNKTKLLGTAPF